MHPAIKIVSLIIVTIFITQGSWFTLLLTAILLLPFYILNLHLWTSAIKMLFRLKWFFLSILIIYYYYTPELQASSSLFNILNERFVPGFFRISVLVIILFSVNLFIKMTSKEEILSALLWLFSPLQFLHIDVERISLRAVLTLDYIEDLSGRLSEYKQKKQSLFYLVELSGIILHEILDEAENTSGKSYTVNCLEAPDAKQFILPMVLCLSLYISL
ncbi:MAG: hypothetical protein KZQ70_06370 [gamma proteobacterium symbiont of Lucinoma myriamae]|nr:hypothetical protein [gamma proteobacterium symbiont of Lucinoma myriamae]MCU7818423.1 hypothetical protein [gamma proteobacterium symbiont of Lucinoma myriamae]MCU7832154.1 hypothetical protein [gamma proteobacterium symbiont of Lucinoma myriamae]